MEQAKNRTNTGAVTPDALLKYLKSLKISFVQYHHPAVFTVKEAKLLRGNVPGEHCKSLFLMEKAGALYLIVCLEWRRLDMRALAELLGSKRLSFGKPKLLLEKLGVVPGSVTPFGIINDTNPNDQQVTVILDREMMKASQVNYHPLVNTMTIGVTPECLVRFLVDCNHTPLILDMDKVTKVENQFQPEK